MFRKRVIIADSSQSFLEGIRGLLETVFDSVVMVAEVSSLLDATERLSPDMVVIDLSLKATDEVGAVTSIRRRYPDLKMIVLSRHDEPAARRKALEAGADGFVLKREAASDLVPAVEAILRGGTYSSSVRSG